MTLFAVIVPVMVMFSGKVVEIFVSPLPSKFAEPFTAPERVIARAVASFSALVAAPPAEEEPA